MELHRHASRQVWPWLLLLMGITVGGYTDGRLARLAAAAVGIVSGLAGLFLAYRPFRFRIGDDGLDLRRPGLRRLVRWPELDALVLEQPPPRSGSPAAPRLVAVPATGVALGRPLDARVDGRPAVELLDLAQVRETPDEIAAALTRCAGPRFRDARPPAGSPLAPVEWTYALRGYRTDEADELIRIGQEALRSDDPGERGAARKVLALGRQHALRPANRGYSTRQVDEVLDALDAALAADPTAREPS
ncbi:hypothetical protein ABZ807_21745 [Micromonospora sp. NPDC047548]|uniref:hypothetical protein n=1 Tax=Micromonospora sp. NPDC047548 TaxID=3155624 RepID=UPI0033CED099